MPRKGEVKKREVLPDPKFHDQTVTKFINALMTRGKKANAEQIFYNAMDIVSKKTKEKEVVKLFKKALNAAKPLVEVRSRRVGGATYQVPVEIRQDRRQALAIRWIIQYARERTERDMENKLAGEFMDILENKGASLKKRDDVHKMADANKAFAHYRW